MSLYYLLWYSFVIATVSLIPGPSMSQALYYGINGNRINYSMAAFGNATASLAQAIIAFLVFSGILNFSSQTIVVESIQVVGALVLFYFSYQIFSARKFIKISKDANENKDGNKKAFFLRGLLLALFNPKAVLFFVSIFPQFITKNGDFGILILLQTFLPIFAIAYLCYMIYAVFGEKILSYLENKSNLMIKINIFFALIFLITGFWSLGEVIV
ncbi:MAG: LysE family translocator [Oligoflexia bacterium]|nr:LysE family translocator [Oligoflexia bacterium]